MNEDSTALKQLQESFQALVMGRVPPATRPDPLEILVPEAERVSARLEIYAQGYKLRMEECMAHDYPGLLQLLGVDLFRELVFAFIEAVPSRSTNVADVGAGFADFLAALDVPEGLGFLPDLARLERHMHDVSWAPDEDTNALPTTPRLSGACRLFSSIWDLAALWDEAQGTHASPGARRYFLVARENDGQASFEEIDELAFLILHRCDGETLLDEILEKALASDGACAPPDEEDLDTRISEWFGQWTRSGVLVIS